MAPFSTEIVARTMIEERRRALARIDREAWWSSPTQGAAPVGGFRRRVGAGLIRVGVWFAGLPRWPVDQHSRRPSGQTGHGSGW